jgi:hypothetical protein
MTTDEDLNKLLNNASLLMFDLPESKPQAPVNTSQKSQDSVIEIAPKPHIDDEEIVIFSSPPKSQNSQPSQPPAPQPLMQKHNSSDIYLTFQQFIFPRGIPQASATTITEKSRLLNKHKKRKSEPAPNQLDEESEQKPQKKARVEQPLAPVDEKTSPDITEQDIAYLPPNPESWLQPISRNKKEYGHVGDLLKVYEKRADLLTAKIHTLIQPAIDATGGFHNPASAVVAANLGGYHEQDFGNVLIYSGQGGDDKTDQTLTRYNFALSKNYEEKVPVRVIRGHKLNSKYAPSIGYRYDGVYFVTKYWSEKLDGTGPEVYKFRLVRLEGQKELPVNNKVLKTNTPTGSELLRQRKMYLNIGEYKRETTKQEKKAKETTDVIVTEEENVSYPVWLL